jgi:hypothetical protein
MTEESLPQLNTLSTQELDHEQNPTRNRPQGVRPNHWHIPTLSEKSIHPILNESDRRTKIVVSRANATRLCVSTEVSPQRKLRAKDFGNCSKSLCLQTGRKQGQPSPSESLSAKQMTSTHGAPESVNATLRWSAQRKPHTHTLSNLSKRSWTNELHHPHEK